MIRKVASRRQLVVLTTTHTNSHSHKHTETNSKSKYLTDFQSMLVKLCDFLFSTVLETRRETTAAGMSWPVAFILAQKKMWQCDCADKVKRERESKGEAGGESI